VTSSARAQSLTVAVGSPNPLLREALSALLRSAPGIRPVVAGDDPSEVARLVAKPAVVLWDATSSDDLAELARQLRSACPPPAGILLLGQSISGAALADVFRAGATGYVTLDSAPADLIALLRQAARGEPAVSPNLAVSLFAQLEPADREESYDDPALTEREMEVLRWVASGATNKRIAQGLYLSVRTIEGHLANIYGKLGVNSRTEAALIAIRRGWAEGQDR
jgi:DNA-binding NarL/FixJ family response regulator